ncbi:MAG: hypothetical protein ACE5HP_01375 [Gemmatimonadota bacterium]
MSEERERRPPPTEEQVRSALLRFGELLTRLDEEGKLLRNLPFLLGRLGDLRRLLFEYEVRVTERLLPVEDPVERDSRRIVRDAMRGEEEMTDEWGS